MAYYIQCSMYTYVYVFVNSLCLAYSEAMQGIPFLICLLFLEIRVHTVLKAELVVCIIFACVSQNGYKLILYQ